MSILNQSHWDANITVKLWHWGSTNSMMTVGSTSKVSSFNNF
jgi:hypothetical protein